jgi:hypothetical protein
MLVRMPVSEAVSGPPIVVETVNFFRRGRLIATSGAANTRNKTGFAPKYGDSFACREQLSQVSVGACKG